MVLQEIFPAVGVGIVTALHRIHLKIISRIRDLTAAIHCLLAEQLITAVIPPANGSLRNQHCLHRMPGTQGIGLDDFFLGFYRIAHCTAPPAQMELLYHRQVQKDSPLFVGKILSVRRKFGIIRSEKEKEAF